MHTHICVCVCVCKYVGGRDGKGQEGMDRDGSGQDEKRRNGTGWEEECVMCVIFCVNYKIPFKGDPGWRYMHIHAFVLIQNMQYLYHSHFYSWTFDHRAIHTYNVAYVHICIIYVERVNETRI